MEDIGKDSLRFQQFPTASGLGASLFGQWHIDPTGEEVFSIPFALAVAEQNQFVCHALILSQPLRAQVAFRGGNYVTRAILAFAAIYGTHAQNPKTYIPMLGYN